MNREQITRALWIGMAAAGMVGGERAIAAQSATPSEPAKTEAKGILPVPDYSGDFWSRSYLTGDWGGERSALANKGLQFDVDWTQIVQSVVDGGRDRDTRYGGTLDYLVTLDLMRMGVMEGALVKMRAETRYGESVNADSGSILPVNTDALFPLTSILDDDIPFTITTLSYTQFLSEKVGVVLGKIDTLDGDPNEFASGRGVTQFMNANFIFNPSLALRLPYSTLAAGVVWLPSPHATVSSMVMNTADSSTTTGFDDFGEGTTWTTEADFQYGLSNLPGGQNVGFLYSFDQDFAAIRSRLVFVPGEGLTIPTENQTWALYWSAWQYLWVNEESDAPINLTNGMPDRQGFGLFARAGIADQDTNPVEWSVSGGVGGRGVLNRAHDFYGVGFYYTEIQTTLLSGLLGIDDHTQGLEGFYNLAITPAVQLTFDVQVVDSALPNVDVATILGARLRLVF